MTYFVYIGHHENRPKGTWYGGKPIAFVDFVKGRKDGKDRLERLCAKHPEVLPTEGWSRLTHRKLDTDDNAVVERLKHEIRTRLSAISTGNTGERRLWSKKPSAPAGCYRLDFQIVNKVVTDAIQQSGLYRPGG